jgi:hypothetical protein
MPGPFVEGHQQDVQDRLDQHRQSAQRHRTRYRIGDRETDREVNEDLTAFACHCHGKLLSF